MAGFTPDEGEDLIGQVIFQRIHVDRDATLELGLFTDSGPAESITEATITEPGGTAYARITLTDTLWAVSGGVASYTEQTFTATDTDFTGATVQGYFISSVAGGTQRIIVMEVDGNGPYDINSGDTYAITPSITIG